MNRRSTWTHTRQGGRPSGRPGKVGMSIRRRGGRAGRGASEESEPKVGMNSHKARGRPGRGRPWADPKEVGMSAHEARGGGYTCEFNLYLLLSEIPKTFFVLYFLTHRSSSTRTSTCCSTSRSTCDGTSTPIITRPFLL